MQEIKIRNDLDLKILISFENELDIFLFNQKAFLKQLAV